MTAAVSSALRQIAGHCCQKDRDVWPQAITRQLGLPASTVRQLPESREETIFEEHDLLDWCSSYLSNSTASNLICYRNHTLLRPFAMTSSNGSVPSNLRFSYHPIQMQILNPSHELPRNAYRLTAVRQDAEAMVLTRQVTVIKACEEPALSSQPARTTSPPAVLSLPQPWQQRIELVTSVFTASRNLAVSQLQRLRGLGAADVAVPRSTGTVT